MNNKIVFGSFETISALTILINTQLLLNFPRIMMEAVGTAGWILVLYITIITFIIFAFITRLYAKFEGMDLIDIGEHVAGTYGRIITGLISILLPASVSFITLRQFAESVKIISLPLSPINFVTVFFIVCMIAGAYSGIESIVRLCAVVQPIALSASLIIFAASTQYFDASRITPLLGNGIYEIFAAGLTKISAYSGMFALFFIAPFIKSVKNFKAIGYTTIILSFVFMLMSVLAFSLTFQYPTGTESVLPLFKLSRLISYGRFFQRVEAIFILTWSLVAMLYLSITLFLTVHIFKKTFRLKYYRPLIMPFAVIIFTLSLMPLNLIETIEMEARYLRTYSWIVVFLFPVLLLFIANIVKTKRREDAAGN